jgi:acyl-CoA synthetase (AMP-forming)/AMP-acid ligase II
MKKTKSTGFAGVPSTFMILLHKSTLKNQKFESLRYITQAGGAMAVSIQKKVVEAFSPAQVFIMYGATEAAARLSYLNPADLPRKWGSIGKAIPNVDLFIADETGNPLLPNQKGEIVARGSNIMQGYWNDLIATNEVLKEGLYWTGDLGSMDEEGFIYVEGRLKDMIKVGGGRVSAKEIEEILLEMKEIQDVAVIGVDDEILGEAIKSYVVSTKGNISIKDIEIHCKNHLPLFKRPKYIEFIDELPKNKSGKTIKMKLKRLNKK